MIKIISVKKINKYIFIPLIILTFMLIFIFNTKLYVQSFLGGLKIWGTVVLPVLFPFFFLTTIMTKFLAVNSVSKLFNPLSKRIFHTSGVSFYIFFMSVLSGYPVGSKLISELYEDGLITQKDALIMSSFCTNSGIIFILGSVGNVMLGSFSVGLAMLLSHILSNLLCGMIFGFLSRNNVDKASDIPLKSKPNYDNFLSNSIYNSVINILVCGGFISLFYVFSDILINNNFLIPINFIFKFILKPFTSDMTLVNGLSLGILEMTRGCFYLSNITSNLKLTSSLIVSVITFGGLSVNIQSIAYLKKAKIKTSYFFLIKIISSILCFFIHYFIVSNFF